MSYFSDLKLLPALLEAITEKGYTQPTPIQAQSIPALLQKRDLLGIAQTGTGKTAAFALPMLQHLSEKKIRVKPYQCRSLILTPTRELASQIYDSFESYGSKLSLSSVVIFGGVGQNPQVRAMQRGQDVVVATPGRLLDLMNQKKIDLSALEIFVLDEADRMLDMGFINDVRKIVAKLPSKRQTLLFSATMPKDIADLAEKLLIKPVKVEVTPESTTVDKIDQRVMFVDKKNKPNLLKHLLDSERIENALVFTRTKHGANKVSQALEKWGVPAAAIHGNKSQTARVRALDGFRTGKLRVLVATDIAARGIDIPGLSHVFNYDLPEVPESYVHRIGRTARAGKNGVAFAFCDISERGLLRQIEKNIRKKLSEDNRHPFVPDPNQPEPPPEKRVSRPPQKKKKSFRSRPRNDNSSGAKSGDKPGSSKRRPRFAGKKKFKSSRSAQA